MRIVVLTGAGISAESGVSTFRNKGGLWDQHRIEDVASPEGFQRDPHLVHRFYNERRKNIKKIQPNRAHIALAEYEKNYLADKAAIPSALSAINGGTITKLENEDDKKEKGFCLITQNIDGLHQRARSQNVLAMHGELNLGRCAGCHQVFTVDGDLSLEASCAHCQLVGQLRPHVVWFGEMPFYLEEIEREIMKCDLFVAIGTSSIVYPAAGLVLSAKQASAYCVEINIERTEMSEFYDQVLIGKATQMVPQFFQY